MTSKQLVEKYLSFFEKKGHKIIPSAPLVPENDPTTLFITAGMQPLVPYLLGQPHLLGKRLVSLQNCLRTDDIDEVGDKKHHTFFQMLGNWSLGDYWKHEAIEWSYEFLTSKEWLGIDRNKLAISVFAGDHDAPFDQESYNIWLKLGIPESRIAKLPKKDNWWGPAGLTGPCGPDTEIFIWTGKGDAPKKFDPNNPEWLEVWNDVFMEYNKTQDGKYELLKQKNVDTGMGLERMTAVMGEIDDDYQTNLLLPIIKKIEEISSKNYKDYQQTFRIIADHFKAAVFIIAANVKPSNKEQGYILRRLLRRGFDNFSKLDGKNIVPIIESIIDQYKKTDSYLVEKFEDIKITMLSEEENYRETRDRAKKFIEKRYEGRKIGDELMGKTEISAADAFVLYSTHGLSPTQIKSLGYEFDEQDFAEKMKKHQELSRKGAEKKFAGGLADQSRETIIGHTATHLLHKGLRDLLGEKVQQKGSNITPERIRFDFSFDRKLSDEDTKKIEEIVNEKIKENLKVDFEVMSVSEAKKLGAIGLFNEKYGEKVKVYSIGNYSKEICGGPHVNFTGELKSFKIIKEENLGANTRRIYAKVG